MKNLLIILFVTVFAIGCSKEIEYNTVVRNQTNYTINNFKIHGGASSEPISLLPDETSSIIVVYDPPLMGSCTIHWKIESYSDTSYTYEYKGTTSCVPIKEEFSKGKTTYLDIVTESGTPINFNIEYNK